MPKSYVDELTEEVKAITEENRDLFKRLNEIKDADDEERESWMEKIESNNKLIETKSSRISKLKSMSTPTKTGRDNVAKINRVDNHLKSTVDPDDDDTNDDVDDDDSGDGDSDESAHKISYESIKHILGSDGSWLTKGRKIFTPGFGIIRNKEYKTLQKRLLRHGIDNIGIASIGKLQIPCPEFKLTPADVAALRWPDQRVDIVSTIGYPPLTLFDLITRTTTSASIVQYVVETVATNNADGVVETEEKPESVLTYAPASATVRTIAHYIKTSKQSIADAPALRVLIDTFLRTGVLRKLHWMILNGNATTNPDKHFNGILNTAGVGTQAAVTDDPFETLLLAKTKVETEGNAFPSAYVINPNDWARILLMTNATGTYFYGGPQSSGPKTLWDTRVVTSSDIAEGTFLVGDWAYALLWDREAASVTLYDQNEDDAIKNMVTILGELRATMGVIRPKAFVKGTIDFPA